LPLLVVVFTGWIPNEQLELGSKNPWPWGPVMGICLIVVGLLGLLFPREPLSEPKSTAQY